jgi:hypothetical protein
MADLVPPITLDDHYQMHPNIVLAHPDAAALLHNDLFLYQGMHW